MFCGGVAGLIYYLIPKAVKVEICRLIGGGSEPIRSEVIKEFDDSWQADGFGGCGAATGHVSNDGSKSASEILQYMCQNTAFPHQVDPNDLTGTSWWTP